MTAFLRSSFLVLAIVATAQPGAAQWTRVTAVPATTIFSVWANGDTAGAHDSSRSGRSRGARS